jgi:hypothetical protein
MASLLLWLLIAGAAHAADPVARAALQTKGTLYVGQEVLVDVDVLVPNYFLQPPQFPQFDLPGAIVTIEDGRALNLVETIGDTDYSGIRRTYVVTPQTAGTFMLPPARITFGYAAEPGKLTAGAVTLPALRFNVEAAPGSSDGGNVVAAEVTVTQVLDGDPAALKAGDTIVRTINVRAQGLRAMMIPEPDLSAPAGAKIYRQDPSLAEEKDDSGHVVAGTRKDVASYVFSEPGTYSLPAIELSWFDPATATTHIAGVPAVTVSVAPATAPASAIPPPSPSERHHFYNWRDVALVVLIGLAAAFVVWAVAIAMARLVNWWSARQLKRNQSEATFFRHAERALKDGNRLSITQTLDAWARRAGIRPLDAWLRRFADAGSIKAYEAYQRSLYGALGVAPTVAVTDQLLVGLRRARSTWVATGDAGAARRKPGLPPLNPW